MSAYPPRIPGDRTRSRPWTDADDKRLCSLFNEDENTQLEIAQLIRRSISAVRRRLTQLRKLDRVGNKNPSRWKTKRFYVKRAAPANGKPWAVLDRHNPQRNARRFVSRMAADQYAGTLEILAEAEAEAGVSSP